LMILLCAEDFPNARNFSNSLFRQLEMKSQNIVHGRWLAFK
jgi:hypothetical protein